MKPSQFQVMGRVGLAVLSLFMGLPPAALAGPEGAQVVHGQVQINQQGNWTTIQASDRAIINYSSFDIQRPETVQFIQPGASAWVLNRVISSSPTNIYGSLLANGRVALVNPAGVYFGPTAQINVNQILASGLNISDASFLSDEWRFEGGEGSVINAGQVTAERLFFVGRQVANHGTILAPEGLVVLAAGETALVRDPNEEFYVEVDGQSLSDLREAASRPDAKTDGPRGTAIENTGTIEAKGGKITFLAGDLYSQAFTNLGKVAATSSPKGQAGQVEIAAASGRVSNQGVIEASAADSASAAGRVQIHAPEVASAGRIEARGGQGQILLGGGNTSVSGSLDASAAEAGRTGGLVEVLGRLVTLARNAFIDVSGPSGGGVARVGGDYQGKGDTPTASKTFVASGVTINADAGTTGNGGRVIVWSDDATGYFGHISARGGSEAGNGGFVEVSGKQNLAFRGTVDVLGPRGQDGTVLLDPDNIIIQLAAGADDGQVSDGLIFFADGGAVDFTIGEAALEALTGNILLQAELDITVNPGVTLDLGNQTAGELVQFQAGGDITIGGAITTNGGDITLSAGDAGAAAPDAAAALNITAAINTTNAGGNGNLTLQNRGTGGITVAANLTVGAGNVIIQDTGDDATLAINGGVNVSGTGTMTFTADKMNISGNVNAGSATVTLQPETTADADDGMDLGSAVDTTADTLELSSAELDRITAGILRLGSTAANGNLLISTALAPAGTSTLRLSSGGTVTQNATATLTETNLRLTSVGVITLNEANSVTTLAANITGAANDFAFRNAGVLALGTVDGLSGVSTNAANAALTLDAGALTQGGGALINATGLAITTVGAVTLTQANTITTLAASVTGAGNAFQFTEANGFSVGTVGFDGVATSNGAITLTATTGGLSVTNTGAAQDVNAGTSTVSLTAAGANQLLTVTGTVQGSGGVTYTADNMTLTGTTTAGTLATLAPNTGGQLVNLGGADAAGTLGILQAELNTVTAGTIRVGSTGSGNFSISAPITASGTTTLALLSGGTITQTGTISETSLRVTSVGAVTLTLGNDVLTLAGNVTGSGNAFSYTDASVLTVGTVDGVSGISTTGSGGITLAVNASTLTSTQPITSGSGAISLTAVDGVTLTGASADVSTSGTYTVDADSNDDATGTYSQDNAGSSVNSSTVSITASDINLVGTLSSGGASMSFIPSTADRTISIVAGAGQFVLTSAELTNLSSSGTVTIGRTDGTGALDVGGSLNISGESYDLNLRGGSVTVNAAVTMGGNDLTLFSGFGNVSSAGQTITTSGGAVTLDFDQVGGQTGNLGTINTNGGALTGNFTGGVTFATINTGTGNITINSGGTITFNGTVDGQDIFITSTGGNIDLNNFDVIALRDMVLDASSVAGQQILDAAGNIRVGLNEDMTIRQRTSVDIGAGISAIQLTDSVNFIVQSTGTAGGEGVVTFSTGFTWRTLTATGQQGIVVQDGDSQTTNSGALTFNATTGDITVQGTTASLTSAAALTLTANDGPSDGDVFVNNVTGTSVAVTASDQITLNTSSALGGNTTLTASRMVGSASGVTIQNTANATVDINGGAGITLNSGNYTVSVTNSLNHDGAVTLEAGNVSFTSTGLGGLVIDSADAFSVAGNITMDFSLGGPAVTLSTLNSTRNGSNGAVSLTFNGDVTLGSITAGTGSVTAISRNGNLVGNGTLNGGSMNITAGQNLTTNFPVNATGLVNSTLVMDSTVGNMNINASMTSGGNMTLTGSGGNFTQGVGASLTSNTGGITINFPSGGAGGQVTARAITANSGAVSVTGGNTVMLNGAVSGNSVSLTSVTSGLNLNSQSITSSTDMQLSAPGSVGSISNGFGAIRVGVDRTLTITQGLSLIIGNPGGAITGIQNTVDTNLSVNVTGGDQDVTLAQAFIWNSLSAAATDDVILQGSQATDAGGITLFAQSGNINTNQNTLDAAGFLDVSAPNGSPNALPPPDFIKGDVDVGIVIGTGIRLVALDEVRVRAASVDAKGGTVTIAGDNLFADGGLVISNASAVNLNLLDLGGTVVNDPTNFPDRAFTVLIQGNFTINATGIISATLPDAITLSGGTNLVWTTTSNAAGAINFGTADITANSVSLTASGAGATITNVDGGSGGLLNVNPGQTVTIAQGGALTIGNGVTSVADEIQNRQNVQLVANATVGQVTFGNDLGLWSSVTATGSTGVSVNAALSTGSGNINLTATTGNVTVTAPVTAANDLTLTANGAGGNLSVTGGGTLAVGANRIMTLSQNAAMTIGAGGIPVGGSGILNPASVDLTAASVGNSVTLAQAVTWNSLSVTGQTGVTLNTGAAQTTDSGNLSFTATTGGINAGSEALASAGSLTLTANGASGSVTSGSLTAGATPGVLVTTVGGITLNSGVVNSGTFNTTLDGSSLVGSSGISIQNAAQVNLDVDLTISVSGGNFTIGSQTTPVTGMIIATNPDTTTVTGGNLSWFTSANAAGAISFGSNDLSADTVLLSATGGASATITNTNLQGTLTATSLATSPNITIRQGAALTVGTGTGSLADEIVNPDTVNFQADSTLGSVVFAQALTWNSLSSTGQAGIVLNGLQSADAGNITLVATTGNLNLGGAAGGVNAFAGDVFLTATTGGLVSATASPISVGANRTLSIVQNNLLTIGAGGVDNVQNTGNVNLSATTTGAGNPVNFPTSFTWNALTAVGQGGVNVTAAQTTDSGNISLSATLGNVSTSVNLTSAADITLRAEGAGGLISQTGGLLTVGTDRTLTVSQDTALTIGAGGLTGFQANTDVVNLVAQSTASSLQFTTNFLWNSITGTGASGLTATATLTTDQGTAGSITLSTTGANSDITVRSLTGRGISVSPIRNLTFNDPAASVVNAGTGSVTLGENQLTVNGNITATTTGLSVQNASDVTLQNTGTVTVNGGNFSMTGVTGNITASAPSSISVQGGNSLAWTPTGPGGFINTTDITTSGGSITLIPGAGQNLTFSGTNSRLDTTTGAGSVTIGENGVGNGNVIATVRGLTIQNAVNVTLSGSGTYDINNGNFTVNTGITGTIDATGAATIDLNGNQLNWVTSGGGGIVLAATTNITDAGAVTLTANNGAIAGSGSLAVRNDASPVTLSQSASLTLGGAGLQFAGTVGFIDLNAASTAGSVTYANPFDFNSLVTTGQTGVAASAGAVLTTDTGVITLTATTGNIDINATAGVNARTNLTLTATAGRILPTGGLLAAGAGTGVAGPDAVNGTLTLVQGDAANPLVIGGAGITTILAPEETELVAQSNANAVNVDTDFLWNSISILGQTGITASVNLRTDQSVTSGFITLLTLGANSDISVRSLTGRGITVIPIRDLSINNSVDAGGVAVSLGETGGAVNGNITAASGLDIRNASNVTFANSGTVTVNGSAFTVNNAVTGTISATAPTAVTVGGNQLLDWQTSGAGGINYGASAVSAGEIRFTLTNAAASILETTGTLAVTADGGDVRLTTLTGQIFGSGINEFGFGGTTANIDLVAVSSSANILFEDTALTLNSISATASTALNATVNLSTDQSPTGSISLVTTGVNSDISVLNLTGTGVTATPIRNLTVNNTINAGGGAVSLGETGGAVNGNITATAAGLDIRNAGDVTLANSGSVTINAGAFTINNTINGTINGSAPTTIQVQGNNVLNWQTGGAGGINYGTAAISAGEIRLTTTNAAATIQETTGSLAVTVDGGDVRITSETSQVYGSGNNEFGFAGTTTFIDLFAVSNAGTITFEDATITLNSITATGGTGLTATVNLATDQNPVGAIALTTTGANSDISVLNLTGTGVTATPIRNLTLGTTVNAGGAAASLGETGGAVNGTITAASGLDIRTASNVTLANSGAVTVSGGSFTINNAVTGNITASTPSSITVQGVGNNLTWTPGGTITTTDVVTQGGTITLTPAAGLNLTVSGPNGRFDAGGGVVALGETGAGNGNIVATTVGMDVRNASSVTFANSGTVSIANGNFTINSGITGNIDTQNVVTIDMAGNALNWSTTGASILLGATNISNASSITLLTPNGTITGTGTLSVNADGGDIVLSQLGASTIGAGGFLFGGTTGFIDLFVTSTSNQVIFSSPFDLNSITATGQTGVTLNAGAVLTTDSGSINLTANTGDINLNATAGVNARTSATLTATAGRILPTGASLAAGAGTGVAGANGVNGILTLTQGDAGNPLTIGAGGITGVQTTDEVDLVAQSTGNAVTFATDFLWNSINAQGSTGLTATVNLRTDQGAGGSITLATTGANSDVSVLNLTANGVTVTPIRDLTLNNTVDAGGSAVSLGETGGAVNGNVTAAAGLDIRNSGNVTFVNSGAVTVNGGAFTINNAVAGTITVTAPASVTAGGNNNLNFSTSGAGGINYGGITLSAGNIFLTTTNDAATIQETTGSLAVTVDGGDVQITTETAMVFGSGNNEISFSGTLGNIDLVARSNDATVRFEDTALTGASRLNSIQATGQTGVTAAVGLETEGGNLQLVATTGAVTATSQNLVAAGGSVVLTATGGGATADVTAGNLTGVGVTVSASDTITISNTVDGQAGNVSLASLNLATTAGLDIQDSANVTLSITGTATLTGGNFTINNAVTGTIDVQNTATIDMGGNALNWSTTGAGGIVLGAGTNIINTPSITLAALNGAIAGAGTLSMQVDGGDISLTQLGNVTVGGGGVQLGGQTDFIDLFLTSTGGQVILNVVPTLNSLTATGQTGVTVNTALTTDSGGITLVANTGNVDLNNNNLSVFTDLSLQAPGGGIVDSGGTLTFTGPGNHGFGLTQQAAIVVDAAFFNLLAPEVVNLSVSSTGGTVTFDDPFTWNSLSATGGTGVIVNDVQSTDAGALSLTATTGDVDAGNSAVTAVGGLLTLNAVNGDVDAGNLAGAGVTVNAGNNTITLDSGGANTTLNATAGAVSLTGTNLTTGTNFDIQNAGNVTLGVTGAVTVAGGNFTINNTITGTITATAPATVTVQNDGVLNWQTSGAGGINYGAAAISAGEIRLTTTNAAATLQETTGTLAVTVDGGDVRLTTETAQVFGGGNNEISFTGTLANIDLVAVSNASTVTFEDTALTLNSINATGSTGLTATVNLSTDQSPAGSITLATTAANSDISVLNLTGTGVTATPIRNLTINNTVNAGGGAVSLGEVGGAVNGNLIAAAGLDIRNASNVTLANSGNVTVSGGAFTINNTVSGTITATAPLLVDVQGNNVLNWQTSGAGGINYGATALSAGEIRLTTTNAAATLQETTGTLAITVDGGDVVLTTETAQVFGGGTNEIAFAGTTANIDLAATSNTAAVTFEDTALTLNSVNATASTGLTATVNLSTDQSPAGGITLATTGANSDISVLNLTGTGVTVTPVRNLTLNNTVNAGGGAVSLGEVGGAVNGNLIAGAGLDVRNASNVTLANSGNVTVSGGAFTINNTVSGTITATAPLLVDVQGNNVLNWQTSGAGGINYGATALSAGEIRLTTTNAAASVQETTGTLAITVDGGDVVLTSETAQVFGSGNNEFGFGGITANIDLVAASNTAAITFEDTALTLNAINATASTGLTATVNLSTDQSPAGGLTLTTTGANSDISVLNLTGTGVTVTPVRNLTLNNTVNAGGGAVSLGEVGGAVNGNITAAAGLDIQNAGNVSLVNSGTVDVSGGAFTINNAVSGTINVAAVPTVTVGGNNLLNWQTSGAGGINYAATAISAGEIRLTTTNAGAAILETTGTLAVTVDGGDVRITTAAAHVFGSGNNEISFAGTLGNIDLVATSTATTVTFEDTALTGGSRLNSISATGQTGVNATVALETEAGNLALTANTGAVNAGALSLTANGGSLTLTALGGGATADATAGALTGVGVTVSASDTITLSQTVNAGAGNASLTATTLSAATSGLDILNAANVSLAVSGTLTVNGGAFTVNNGITGTINATGTGTISVQGNNVLNWQTSGAGGINYAAAALSAGEIRLTTTNAAATLQETTGSLAVTVDGGDVRITTEAGQVFGSGNNEVAFAGTTANIDLIAVSNTGAITFEDTALTLNSINATGSTGLTATASLSTDQGVSGPITLTTTGANSDISVLNLTGTGVTVTPIRNLALNNTVNAGGGAVSLGEVGGAVNGNVTAAAGLDIRNAGNVTLANSGTVTVSGGAFTVNTSVAGTVNLSAPSAISVQGSNVLNVQTSGAGGIIYGAAAISAGEIRLTTTHAAATIQETTGTLAVTVDGGDVRITTETAQVFGGGNNEFGFGGTTANIDLVAASNAAAITFEDAALTLNSINAAASTGLTATVNLSTDQGASGSITLATTGANSDISVLNLTGTGVAVTPVRNLTLNNTVNAGGGAVSLGETGGSVNGNITATTGGLDIRSAGNVTLANSGSVSVNGGSFTINNAVTGTINASAAATVNVQGTNALDWQTSGAGGINYGNSDLNAGAITLVTTNAAAAIQQASGGSLAVNADGGDITLRQGTGLTVGTGGVLFGGTAGNIDLSATSTAGSVTFASALTLNSITASGQTGVTVNASQTTDSGVLNLVAATGAISAGSVSLTAKGALSLSAVGGGSAADVTAGNLTGAGVTVSASDRLTLSNAIDAQGGSVALTAAGLDAVTNGLDIQDSNLVDLNVSGTLNVSSGSLTINNGITGLIDTRDTASISVQGSGSLAFQTSGGGGIQFGASSLQAGSISLATTNSAATIQQSGGLLAVNADGGGISLSQQPSLTLGTGGIGFGGSSDRVSLSATSGAGTVTFGNAATFHTVSIVGQTGVTLNGNLVTDGGLLSVTANGGTLDGKSNTVSSPAGSIALKAPNILEIVTITALTDATIEVGAGGRFFRSGDTFFTAQNGTLTLSGLFDGTGKLFLDAGAVKTAGATFGSNFVVTILGRTASEQVPPPAPTAPPVVAEAALPPMFQEMLTLDQGSETFKNFFGFEMPAAEPEGTSPARFQDAYTEVQIGSQPSLREMLTTMDALKVTLLDSRKLTVLADRLEARPEIFESVQGADEWLVAAKSFIDTARMVLRQTGKDPDLAGKVFMSKFAAGIQASHPRAYELLKKFAEGEE